MNQVETERKQDAHCVRASAMRALFPLRCAVIAECAAAVLRECPRLMLGTREERRRKCSGLLSSAAAAAAAAAASTSGGRRVGTGSLAAHALSNASRRPASVCERAAEEEEEAPATAGGPSSMCVSEEEPDSTSPARLALPPGPAAGGVEGEPGVLEPGGLRDERRCSEERRASRLPKRFSCRFDRELRGELVRLPTAGDAPPPPGLLPALSLADSFGFRHRSAAPGTMIVPEDDEEGSRPSPSGPAASATAGGQYGRQHGQFCCIGCQAGRGAIGSDHVPLAVHAMHPRRERHRPRSP